ncbi:MAG: type 4a pilus biogenesis protein PilO [Gemmatimonadota bacterium]|nr:type 4a pilus biogenesis protein PilO [Gemmatimonadota bacterium]
MAIIPTTNRDRTFAGAAFVALALAGAYYLYVWQPKRDELAESQTRVDSLLVINQRAKADLAQNKTQALKEEADRLAADLTVMRLLVPTGNEVPTLLDQVSTAARRVGLDIADVQPLPSLAGDQYEAYKYRLVVRGGSYHQIGNLLANIGSLQRIVAPINLVLSPQSADPRAPKKARSQNLEARFEILTYVARAPLPPAPVKGVVPDAPKPGEK